LQKLKLNELSRIKSILRKSLNKFVLDIFILGSAVKDKLEPADLDLIVLFSEKDSNRVGKVFFDIRERLGIDELHIEGIYSDDLFSENIFGSVLHEGISVKDNSEVSKLLGYCSKVMFNYALRNLDKVEKVRFSQALYGRKKDGLLHIIKGESLGNGSFLVSIKKEEIIKEFFKKWKVKYSRKRVFVSS